MNPFRASSRPGVNVTTSSNPGGEFIAAPRHHRFANQVRQNPLPEARLLQQIDRRSGANEVAVAGDDDTYVGKVPAGVVTSPDDDVSPPEQLCRETVPGGMICHPGFSRLARNCSVICFHVAPVVGIGMTNA